MRKLNMFNAFSGKTIAEVNSDESAAESIEEFMDESLEDLASFFYALAMTPTLKGKTVGEAMELLMNDDGTLEAQVSKELGELDPDEEDGE